MLLSHQKVGNNAIYSNIEGTNHDYIRESKSVRGRQIYEITDKLILKSDTKELISITDTESQTLKRHLVLQKGSHCKEGLNQDTGINMGIPGGQTVKNPTAVQETRVQSLGKIPWRRKWQPTPVFLPGESHGQISLVAYLPWSCKNGTRLSDTFTRFFQD